MMNRLATVALVVLVVLAAYAGYRVFYAQIETGIYRHRLIDLNRDYDQLLESYNTAVRKTAVTELLVQDGQVCVVVRTAEGVLETIQTPFDPNREIYVDYVVLDGRLWIRRVFDARTRPDQGVLVDPKLADIDWVAGVAVVGKAAYRRLDEGRWVVTVTGDGSLGLARGDEAADLALPPPVHDYAPIDKRARDEVEQIGPADVFRQIVRGNRGER